MYRDGVQSYFCVPMTYSQHVPRYYSLDKTPKNKANEDAYISELIPPMF